MNNSEKIFRLTIVSFVIKNRLNFNQSFDLNRFNSGHYKTEPSFIFFHFYFKISLHKL